MITASGPSELSRRHVLDLTTAVLAILELEDQSELVPSVDGAVEFTDGGQAEYALESRSATEALRTGST